MSSFLLSFVFLMAINSLILPHKLGPKLQFSFSIVKPELVSDSTDLRT